MTIASIAIPTVTVVACHPQDHLKVLLVKSVNKHDGRLVLVGGCLNLQNCELPRRAVVREFTKEVGGKGATLEDLTFWTVKSDPYLDVRASTLGKLTHDRCQPGVTSLEVAGHYGCPDWLFVGKVVGEPFPKDGEVEDCVWFDLRDLQISANPLDSQFGADHDLILGFYKFMKDWRLPPDIEEFLASTNGLRSYLRSKLRK